MKLNLMPFALLIALPVMGQREDASMLRTMKDRNQMSMSMGKVRYDLVNSVQQKIETFEDASLRIATREANGWAVRVLTPEGSLVMTGLYADEELTLAHGTFTYFHTNGRIESTGQFVNGNKTGVWLRYDTRGEKIAERVYSDRNTEGIVLPERGHSLARTK